MKTGSDGDVVIESDAPVAEITYDNDDYASGNTSELNGGMWVTFAIGPPNISLVVWASIATWVASILIMLFSTLHVIGHNRIFYSFFFVALAMQHIYSYLMFVSYRTHLSPKSEFYISILMTNFVAKDCIRVLIFIFSILQSWSPHKILFLFLLVENITAFIVLFVFLYILRRRSRLFFPVPTWVS